MVGIGVDTILGIMIQYTHTLALLRGGASGLPDLLRVDPSLAKALQGLLFH